MTSGHEDAAARVRFAPSPTGPFHIGGARTALYNYLFAKSVGGTFILRIDDTDTARSTDEHLQGILDSMRWLGFEWDEGPEKGGDFGPYFQSQRMEGYRERAAKLVDTGHAYPCFCTPEEIQEGRERMQREQSRAIYDRRCRHIDPDERAKRLANGDRHTIRFAVPEGVTVIEDRIMGRLEVKNEEIDDFVILREDTSPLYNLCSALDDVDMRITHVIRGLDHLTNAVKQTLLLQALDYDVPQFAHLPLILGPNGKKLSKRVAQTNLLDYRDQGYPVEALVNFFTRLGWGYDDKTDIFTMDEAIAKFKLSVVGKAGAVLDEEKLLWMCGMYIRETPLPELLDRCAPWLVRAGYLEESEIESRRDWLLRLIENYRERIKLYRELPEKVCYFFRGDLDYDAKATKNLKKAGARDLLVAYRGVLDALPFESPQQLEEAGRGLAAELEIGFGKLVHPVRAALTFTNQGAGMFDIVHLLGKDEVRRRLDRAIDFLT